MSEISVPASAESRADAHRVARPRPRWLALAHAVWLICAALALLMLLAAIPLGYVRLWSGAGLRVAIDAPAWYIAGISVAQGVVSFATALVSLALAGVIFWKRRDDRGALLVSFYLLGYGVILAGPLEALAGFPPLFPGASTANATLIPVKLIVALQSAIFIPTMWLMYLFPNGQFVPRWTRFAALMVALIAPLFVYASAYEWLPTTTWLTWFVFTVVLGLMGVGVYAQIHRYRRVATPMERQQTKWVVFGLALTVFVIGLDQIPYTMISQLPVGAAHPWWAPLTGLIWWLSLVIIPFSFAIAVLGYRLWDIDLLINRALVYGALTALVVGVFVLVVASMGALFQTSGEFFISLLATALIAVLFQPLRERVQRGVNRLMYGERDDPYRVLTRLGVQLESTMQPAAALTQTVETVAAALKLPYVAIALKQDDAMQIVAAHGPAADAASRFPLSSGDETIGELLVAPRAPGDALTPADERLLRDLARQISIVARTAALTSDLEHARLRLVTERGEARRQLGSDLHDGVGHQLVALTRLIESVTPKSVDAAAPLSKQFLGDVQRQLVAMTTQVRSLAHQLYPPELQVLGLSGALRERADGYPALRILIDAPQTLPALPAEIETAAYYIALEAITNADKHAQAKTCRIRLALSAPDTVSQQRLLELDIVDDGRGMAEPATHGLGLLSMRARAAEVGGSCAIAANPGGGVAVSVRIPCPAPGA